MTTAASLPPPRRPSPSLQAALDLRGPARTDTTCSSSARTPRPAASTSGTSLSGSFSLVLLGTFPTPSGIIIDGRGGNDVIAVDAAVTVPVQLSGGAGNDLLIGGAGDDLILEERATTCWSAAPDATR